MNHYLTEIELDTNKRDLNLIVGFIKWSIVVLTLLIPNGPTAITIIALLLAIVGKVSKNDLFFLFFLTGFINGSLGNFEGNVMLRYLILLPLIFNSRSIIMMRKVLKFPVLIFFLYLITHSLLISPNPIFSLLNVGTAFLTIIAGFSAIYCDREESFWISLLSIYLVIVFWSLISIPFPEFSYIRNGVGLQGIATHPNLFAVFLVPICFYTFSRSFIKPSLKYISVFSILFLLLYLSQSRTAIFTLALSIIIYIFFAKNMIQQFAKRSILLMVPALIIGIIFSGAISDIFLDILTKGAGDSISFSESVERSRGALFLAQIQNITSYPLTGIGFKILSNGESNNFFEVSATGNAYEKGVFLMALIEETGIIGALLFAGVLYSFLSHIIKRKVGSALFFVPVCYLITTFGEATLLSIGGNASLIWATIAFSDYKYKMNSL